jgi:signal transduction histidine kinase
MRSIRRSLLGYLLLLLAVSLGAVGVLVERFANAALRKREESETERIQQTFKVRAQEEKTKFDGDLVLESKSLARDVHFHTRSLVGQNLLPAPRPGAPPKMPEPAPTLKASEDEARQFRLRSAMLEFAPGPNLWASLAPVAAVEPIVRGNNPQRHFPYPNWVEFEGPRAISRIQESLRKTFAEEHSGHQFQITLITTYSGRPGRNVVTVRSERLPDDLSVEGMFVDPQGESVPRLDSVNIPGLGPSRRVVTGTVASGRSIVFWLFLPSPPTPANHPRYRDYPPYRGPDMILRVFVHVVRPESELDTRLAADQKARDEQLTRVSEETRTQLLQLRQRLILIGSITFAALVLGGWWIVARGLAPLHKLSEAVSQVSEKDFRLTVVPAELGRELAPIHARLTQTLTLLQKAFAREKQAVADISHELRTPIASLLATIDVALRKPRTPDQYRTALEECRLISKQLGQLVERIMTLASLDAGNDHIVVSRTDAVELANGCAAVIRPLAATNNIMVSVRYEEELSFDTDAGKLREVLMNLLHNAVEYNKPGGTITLTISRENSTALFEVRDTGIGMTPEVREKIFERFFRADSSRQATGIHAGLGLAIVKEYVARLNGSIEVESEPGVGTTFRVTLPLHVPNSSPPAAPPPPPAPPDRAKKRDAVPTGS